MNSRTIPLPFQLVNCNSTTALFVPVTGWMPTGAASKLRQTWELIQATGNLEIAPGHQVADYENSLGAATALGSFQSTAGIHYPTGWTTLGVRAIA